MDDAAGWIINSLPGLKPALAGVDNTMLAFTNKADDVAAELTPTQKNFLEVMEEAKEKAAKAAVVKVLPPTGSLDRQWANMEINLLESPDSYIKAKRISDKRVYVSIDVQIGFQGQGNGTALYEALEKEVVNQMGKGTTISFRTILHQDAEQFDKAEKFWKKMGFEQKMSTETISGNIPYSTAGTLEYQKIVN